MSIMSQNYKINKGQNVKLTEFKMSNEQGSKCQINWGLKCQTSMGQKCKINMSQNVKLTKVKWRIKWGNVKSIWVKSVK